MVMVEKLKRTLLEELKRTLTQQQIYKKSQLVWARTTRLNRSLLF
jgi:hypothetical protein